MYSNCSLVFSYVKGSFVPIWVKLLRKLWRSFNCSPGQYIVSNKELCYEFDI